MYLTIECLLVLLGIEDDYLAYCIYPKNLILGVPFALCLLVKLIRSFLLFHCKTLPFKLFFPEAHLVPDY